MQNNRVESSFLVTTSPTLTSTKKSERGLSPALSGYFQTSLLHSRGAIKEGITISRYLLFPFVNGYHLVTGSRINISNCTAY